VLRPGLQQYKLSTVWPFCPPHALLLPAKSLSYAFTSLSTVLGCFAVAKHGCTRCIAGLVPAGTMLRLPCHAPATTTPSSKRADNLRDRAILALILTDRAKPITSKDRACLDVSTKCVSNDCIPVFCVRERQQRPPKRDWLVSHRGGSTNCCQGLGVGAMIASIAQIIGWNVKRLIITANKPALLV
jgi:hypothetical protein